MSKKKIVPGSVCTYCQTLLNEMNWSEDHVVPKCLFSERQRGGLIKVPACKQCNNREKSVDDAYFRDWLICHIDVDYTSVPSDVYAAFMRSAGDNPDGKVRSKVARAAMTGGRWVPRFTSSGLFAGVGYAYQGEDDRLRRTGTRIAQALYYSSYHEHLPSHTTYSVGPIARQDGEPLLLVLGQLGARQLSMGGGECQALCIHARDDEGGGVCAVLVFYNSVGVVVMARARSSRSE